MHVIPNSLCILPVITKIINLSLSTGSLPMAFKLAYSLVIPLHKIANLDKENLSNYRLFSNLSFLSKLTERSVLARLNDYLSSNSLLNPHQSGFSHQHVSCFRPMSPQHLCCIRHYILQRLSSWFGVSGTAL